MSVCVYCERSDANARASWWLVIAVAIVKWSVEKPLWPGVQTYT